MADALLSTWAQADAFLGDGGTYVTISKPTADDIAPYVSYLTGHQNANIDPDMGKFYTLALYGLNESIKDKYPDPELIIAINKNNQCCGVCFYYDITIDGVDSYWIGAWSQTEKSPGALFILLIVGAKAAKNNKYSQWFLDPSMNIPPGSRYGINGEINPDTKWNVLTPAQMLAMVDAQKDAVAQTQYLSKEFDKNLSWYLNPTTTGTN